MRKTWMRCRVFGPARALVAAGVLAVAGSALADPQVGAWTKPESWPLGPTHTSVLSTGKVLIFGEFEYGDFAHLYDPATGTLTPLDQAGYNIFCAGHSFLADGKLLIAGGHLDSHVGFPHGAIFDPVTQTFSRTPDMRAGRWYPTNTTLASGEVVVSSGEMTSSGDNNPIPEVWQPKTGTWRLLSGANFEFDYYPRQFLAPNGKVFVATPQAESYWLDTAGTGSVQPAGISLNEGERAYGGAVMYERGKILVDGGGDPPTASAEVIDLNAPAPAWRAVAPMSVARRQHNSTLLPDGRVLVTGGSSGGGFNNRAAAVYPAEVWDPVTETWTTWASNTAYRGYHSTAVLLPDGRILVGGGRGSGDYTAQIFSPPYLFKGTRPEITAIQAATGWNAQFDIATPTPQAIARVTMLAPAAVTHSFDQNQRFLELPFVATATGVKATAPADPNLAPPGFYLVFLLDANGVPSVGKFIQLAGDVAPPPDSVTVVEPNGGDLFSPGTMAHVSWGLTGNVTAVDVEFSPDNGATWTPLATNLPIDPPHFEWQVPDQTTEQALVRVRMAGSSEVYDQSDKVFSIGYRWNGIAFGDSWKYRDDGADPGSDWMNPGYDDSGWKTGNGELGYGEGDETTELTLTTPAQTGVYFRKSLTLPGLPTAATVKVKFDDGYAMWVNGNLVSQRNVDRGVGHEVYASATAENLVVTETIPPSAFVEGSNVVAVTVKQLGPTSNDLSFDAELQIVGATAEAGGGGSGGDDHAGDGGAGGTGERNNPLASDSGCGCTHSAGGGGSALLLGLLALALRLRRRGPRGEADA